MCCATSAGPAAAGPRPRTPIPKAAEGTFYLWAPAEFDRVLGAGADAAKAWFDVTEAGNFEGRNILNRRHHRQALSRPAEITAARAELAAARRQRVRPGLDDKCLTEWNALMCSALAEAAAAMQRPDWLAAAVANGEFLLRELRGSDGRWLRSWQAGGGAADILAYAADHAALVDAFVRLAEASGQARWITAACEAADALLDLFWDGANGGLFTTGSDAPPLITRPKEVQDNAVPSADSMAALALRRLWALTGDDRYRHHASTLAASGMSLALRHPLAFGHLLSALELATASHEGGEEPLTEIVITGDRADLVGVAHRRWLPHAVLAWGEPYDSALWSNRSDGWAYVCRGGVCQLPVQTPAELDAQLDRAGAGS